MTDGTGFAGGIIGFMRNNRVQLAYDGAFDEATTIVNDDQGRPRVVSHGPITWCATGPVADTLEFPSDTWFNMLVGRLGNTGPSTTTDRTITLLRSKGSVDTGVRYLPWQPDRATYMRMRGGAKLFFTGPLTGCNIYVAGPRSGPVVFHTNNNSAGDDQAANGIAKRKMATDLLAQNILGLGQNTLIGGALERASYSGNFMGFVFGYKNGTDWSFYFNGIGAGTQVLKRIF
ncbi:MAG: hypothetical protein K5Q68_13970 [Roseococcus sp.]|nr:hypothetical protein [Roseococcus sp.]